MGMKTSFVVVMTGLGTLGLVGACGPKKTAVTSSPETVVEQVESASTTPETAVENPSALKKPSCPDDIEDGFACETENATCVEYDEGNSACPPPRYECISGKWVMEPLVICNPPPPDFDAVMPDKKTE